MARERDTESTGDSTRFDRRSCLKLAGATIASSSVVGLASNSVAAQDYETVTVSAGETKRYSVGTGETLENLFIDATADGASAKITTSGSDWTVRNVGIKGEHPGGHYQMIVRVDDPDGTGRLENVYLGDPQTPRSSKGGIYWNSANSQKGTIVLDRVHIANKVDNGFYGEGDGHGRQIVKNSYFYNNTITNVRVGSKHSTARVENTTIHVDGDNPACGVGCSSPGSQNTRAVWSWFGEAVVKNCDIRGAPLTTMKGGSITTENVRTGQDADVTPPEGVPMSAEEAASGTSSAGSGGSGDDSDEETTTEPGDGEGTVLELIAGSNASNVSYEFTVEGSVAKRTNAGDVSAESSDTVTDNGDGTVTVSGVAGNGYGDSYRVDGDVVSMDLDESQWTIRWDGNEVGVDELTGSASSQLPNKLVIDGSNRPRAASTYTFEVSGEVEKDAELGTVNAYDTVSDGTVSGRIIGGADGYRFSGEITGFSLDGPAKVRIEDGS